MRTKGIVQGLEVEVLNDSGAQITAVSSKFADKTKACIDPQAGSDIRILNPNGDPFTILGTVPLDIQFSSRDVSGSVSLRGQAYVLRELTCDIILGQDTLEPNGTIVRLLLAS